MSVSGVTTAKARMRRGTHGDDAGNDETEIRQARNTKVEVVLLSEDDREGLEPRDRAT